jgi:hypothetical protein
MYVDVNDIVPDLIGFVFLKKKLPPYTLAGFDLTTHDSADTDDTTINAARALICSVCTSE